MSGRVMALAGAGLVGLVGCGPGSLTLESGAAALRPDHPFASEPRYDSGMVLESVVSPAVAFRVHFVRTGPDRVPGAGDPVPRYVEDVARTYDAALDHYRAAGYLDPLGDEGSPEGDGGDGLLDVYLVDFFGRGDGNFVVDFCVGDAPSRCAGHIRHENDFAGYRYPSLDIAHRILASHELFHAVQAAYSSGEAGPLTEGTAVWATETFDPSLIDFEAFVGAYLSSPDRSLDTEGGGFDAFVYGAALFFRFLEETQGEETIRAIWERRAEESTSETWLESVDQVLLARGARFEAAFERFSAWNLAIGAVSAETYREAERYPPVARRPAAVPVTTDRLRVFPASMHVYEVDAAGRSEVMVEAVSRAEDDLEGLRVLTFSASAGAVDAGGPEARAVRLGAGGSTLLVGLVDTRMSGRSLRPVLCVGSPEENAACAALVRDEPPPAPDPDPPEDPDPIPDPSADPGSADPEEPGASPEAVPDTVSSGCRAGSGRAPSDLLVLVGLLGLVGRRRRSVRR